MPRPRCDFYNKTKEHCAGETYAEVYWKKGARWSYLCKKHFGEKRRLLKGWGILDEWWISDQFMLAIRKIENKFGICQTKNTKWCLAVEFNDKIHKLAEKIFESVEEHKAD